MKFRKPHLHWLICSVAVLIFFSAGRQAFHDSWDFVPVYTGARCLLYNCNPYDTSQLEQQYFQAGATPGERPPWTREVPMYPPSIFLVFSPLALLRYPTARLLWFLMNGCLFVAAAALVLSLCPRSQRCFSTVLISVILATSRILLLEGNPAIFAISLLAMGIYLFHRARFLPVAAVLLALSLTVKPTIGILIVLYLMLNKSHWRYAAVAAAGAVAILFSGGLILSHHSQSADWAKALPASIAATEKPGAINDPRPGNMHAISLVNLQAITGIFSSNETVVNALAYAIFLALLAVWIVAYLGRGATPEMHFLLLAALSVLTLLPVYHRFYDTRMLLFSVPAVAIIFDKRRFLGTFIGVFTLLALFSVQARLRQIFQHNAIGQSIMQNKFLYVLLLRQQSLELLLLFTLYMFAIFSIRFPNASTSQRYSPGP